MRTLIHEAVESARAGENPTCICQVPSGWILMGYTQFFNGYSLLLADPVVADLNCLTRENRIQFLDDMAVLGDALLEVTEAYRINYEILGNTEQALHAHVFPRYMSESEQLRKGPVWSYPEELRNSVKFDPERDRELMNQVASAVQKNYR